MRRLLCAFFVISTALGVACSSFKSTSAVAVDTSDAGDAGADATDAVDAGQEDAAPVVGCAGGIIYVASSGDDVNTGCDQRQPKKTVQGAIGYAKTLRLTNQEIHVCAGTYAEDNLVLDYPISLRGGYECATFQRASSFGWGGFNQTTGHASLDMTNETIVTTTTQNALEVFGATLTSAVMIEGFTLRGRATGGGAGLIVHDGAAPIVKANHIVGALAGTVTIENALAGSAGVGIQSTATPEITNNIIEGGGGGAAAPFAVPGSEGVLVQTTGLSGQPEPHIHDNEIDSGNGVSSAVSTVGIDLGANVVMTDANAVSNNAIFFGGSSAYASFATIGIWVRGSAANLAGNGIYSESVSCSTSASCLSTGIFVVGSDTSVVGNRIAMHGDDTAQGVAPNIYNVYVQLGTKRVLIANNLLAIDKAGRFTTAATVNVVYAIDTVHIEANTMFGFASLADGIVTVGNDVTIDDNLMVGLRYGINTVAGQCLLVFPPMQNLASQNQYPPIKINNNVFADMTAVASLVTATDATSACGGSPSTPEPHVADLQSALAQANANLVLDHAGCGPKEATCLMCTSADCISDVFATAPVAATVVNGKASLSPTVACQIAQDGAVTAVTTDLVGATRTTGKVSVGALQDDGTCTLP